MNSMKVLVQSTHCSSSDHILYSTFLRSHFILECQPTKYKKCLNTPPVPIRSWLSTSSDCILLSSATIRLLMLSGCSWNLHTHHNSQIGSKFTQRAFFFPVFLFRAALKKGEGLAKVRVAKKIQTTKIKIHPDTNPN